MTIGNDTVHTVITREGKVVEELVHYDGDKIIPQISLGEITSEEYFRLRTMLKVKLEIAARTAARLS